MEYCRIVLLSAFIFWNIFCVSGQDKYVMVDTSTLNYENLNTIFNALKKYGLTKKPEDQQRAAQYTCTTVLAEEEVNDVSWLGSEFPDSFTQNDRRIRVQYNKDNNKDHGEKIVLKEHLEGLIQEMQKDSRAKKYNIYPVVIMYSEYIPCSITEHTCAARLANDKMKRTNSTTEYSLVIGYSEYYIYQHRHKNWKELTIKNIKESFKTLSDGQIAVYRMILDFSSHLSTIVLKEDFSDILQTNLYDCLVKQPLAYCCSTNIDTNVDQAIKEFTRIVSFSINSMIYNCKDDVTSTRKLVQKLETCFGKWVDANIGPDCRECASGPFGEEILKAFIKQCLKQVWKFSTYIGALSNPTRLDDPAWTLNNQPQWSTSPADFKSNIALRCYDVELLPDSFCTKKENNKRKEENLSKTKEREGPFEKKMKISS